MEIRSKAKLIRFSLLKTKESNVNKIVIVHQWLTFLKIRLMKKGTGNEKYSKIKLTCWKRSSRNAASDEIIIDAGFST